MWYCFVLSRWMSPLWLTTSIKSMIALIQNRQPRIFKWFGLWRRNRFGYVFFFACLSFHRIDFLEILQASIHFPLVLFSPKQIHTLFLKILSGMGGGGDEIVMASPTLNSACCGYEFSVKLKIPYKNTNSCSCSRAMHSYIHMYMYRQ